MTTKKIHHYYHDLLCIIGGALLVFAFAPVRFSGLAILCPTILLWCYRNSHHILRIMIRAFLFGFSFFATGVSWTYISIHQFGGANFILSITITLLFISCLSLFFVLQAALYYLYPNDTISKSLLVFPASWVILCEWLRGFLFSGFPWLYLGFSQNHSLLGNYAPIIGVYGVSFLTLLTGALLFNMIRLKKIACWQLATVIFIWLLALLLAPIAWTKAKTTKVINIAVIQGNIPQSVKWQPEMVEKTIQTYLGLTKRYWQKHQSNTQAKLVIWPESAIPLLVDQAPSLINQLDKLSKRYQTTLITGILTRDHNRYFNSAMAIGLGSGIYNKRHLVPFGEYTPLGFNKLEQALHIPMSDFNQGAKKQSPLTANGIIVATFICYEIAYAGLLRLDLPQSQLLINISDDAWFGHSFASSQQLQIAAWRAKEAQRYLITATNNGISAVINPRGQIISQLAPFTKGILEAKVYPMSGQTPWMIIGNWPLITILIIILVLIKCWQYINATDKTTKG